MTRTNETRGAPDPSERNVWQALWHGFWQRCPSCGVGKSNGSFLKIVDHCAHCNEALHHHKADDAPAYFTIMVVGHIVVPMLLWSEVAYKPSYTFHIITWPVLTVVLSLLLLPRIKGALVALQWANRMHGFNPDTPDEDELAKEKLPG